MNKAAEVFKLYANCVPVKGARRSVLCDLQRQRAQFIPNDLYDILTEFAEVPVAEIKTHFDEPFGKTIDEYFGLLITQEYGFWTDEPEMFPALDLSWDRSETITNALIDVDCTSQHDYRSLFTQLDELGCRAVQVRAYDPLSLAELDAIVGNCRDLRLRHIDLVVKYLPELTHETLAELCLRHQVISRVIVHSSPEESRAMVDPLPVLVRFFTQEVKPSSCGHVEPDYFSLTIEHFTEAQHFNTCLNRKLSITAQGEIKNCPAMSHSLGHARDTRLASVIGHPTLIQLGGITKDQIEVCRDCEFRYICTDCRAYTRDGGNLYSKPAKCAYDPYTATWSNREVYSLSSLAG